MLLVCLFGQIGYGWRSMCSKAYVTNIVEETKDGSADGTSHEDFEQVTTPTTPDVWRCFVSAFYSVVLLSTKQPRKWLETRVLGDAIYVRKQLCL